MSFDIEKFTNIKNIYISSEEFWQANTQSCDCLDLIVDTGKTLISVKYFKREGHWWIDLNEITDFSNKEYKFKVFMNDEVFKFEKVYYCEGLIDAIKLKCKDVFLFIFADEYNLILTKSKYDLLDDTGELCDEEATLTIIDNY